MKRPEMYKNKIILAPMVRMCALPFRLLCLEYGADLVYCEELIDFKILRCERIINKVLGTVDFVDKTDGNIIFRTCAKEKNKVVLQIGTCDPKRAAEVGVLVENDVAAIDINMGCPKEFSIKGGMGAALLNNIEKACNILKSVVNSVKIPVTCKIRVLPDIKETLELCKKLENTGISAIAIHGRTRWERPCHDNRNEMLKVLSSELQIPVIANGGSREIECYEDIGNFLRITGCNSAMLARSVQYDCSIFRKEGKLPLDDIIKSYLRYAIDYDNAPASTKYCVQSMLRQLQDTPRGRKFLDSQTLLQICDIWGLGDYCRCKQSEYFKRGSFGRWNVIPETVRKKRKMGESLVPNKDLVTSLQCIFLRNMYSDDQNLPKTKLLTLSRKNHISQPRYQTIQFDKLFTSTVTYNGKKYTSTFWEKNKRCAEQGAAIVCLCSLGIYEIEHLKENGILKD